jgi:myo-inositol 2-dehydrogenase / D-chiro-inositol 1-dehydrogenase
MIPANDRPTSRRTFLKNSTAAALGSALSAPLILGTKSSAASPGDTIKVGLVGCGGRGSGAAKQALNADKNVILTCMGDAFPDRLQSSLKALKADSEVGERVRVEEDNCFTGFDAYQKVIDSGVDVVILTSPPGFRPAHLKAAIEANKHVFCEKPMATDAPGVRSVLESVAEAKKRKLAVVAGFCWRYNLAERAGFAQIHDGAVGHIRAIYGTYNTGSLWSKPRQESWTDMEWQVRNWLYFTWLSGDHLVEQCVHTVDKMAWAMADQPPIKAIAHGGRQVRTAPEYGHIFDHFEIVYHYPNDAHGFIFCRQQANCASDTSDTIMGTKGVAKILGFRSVPVIKGETNWKYEGPRPDMYQVEHDELFASIRKGQPINDGVRMAHSTMLAIMGRMAAYTGQEITWEEAMNSKENLHPPKLDWDAPLPMPPVAIPGKTKFI